MVEENTFERHRPSLNCVCCFPEAAIKNNAVDCPNVERLSRVIRIHETGKGLVMVRLYLYSKSDLRYKSVKSSRLVLAAISIVLFSSVLTMICGHLGVDLFGLYALRADTMARENSVLKARLTSMDRTLDRFRSEVNSLGKSDDQLRTAVNLPVISAGEKEASVGGVEINRDFGIPAGEGNLLARALDKVGRLERETKFQKQSFARIREQFNSNQKLFSHIPAIDPIRGGLITDGFGERMHPILHMLIMHDGIDIEAEPGTHVHVTGDGVVSYVGRRGGYGNVVEVDNGFGYTTLYAHLEKALVTVGEKVKRGQVIALTGDTGLSTGPHLHYGVMKDGVFVNPESYYFPGSRYSNSALYDSLGD